MAVASGPTGIGSELDEALVRAGRYLHRGVVSADVRTLQKTGGREGTASTGTGGAMTRSSARRTG